MTAEKTKKKKDPIGFFKMIKVSYSLIFRVCPIYYSVQQVIAVSHGLSHAVSATAMMGFFDAVERSIKSGGTEGTGVFLWFAFFAGVALSREVLNGVHNFMHQVIGERLTGHMRHKMHIKSSKIDPVEYENPDRLDDIEKASRGAGSIFTFSLIITTLVTFYLPYFVYMAFFMSRLRPELIAALGLAFVPALASQLVRTKILSKLEDDVAPLRRKMSSYEEAVFDIKYMKETRILGAYSYIKKLYLRSLKTLNRENFRARLKINLIRVGLDAVTLACYGAVIIYTVYLFVHGEVTAGAFAAVYNSLGLVFGIMDEIVNRHIGHISENFGYIRNFIRFIEMDEQGGAQVPMDKTPGISLKNVSFRYPNAEKDSLKNVTLDIKPGETLAIVGENGAGKTTLVRLITGIYRPTAGEIDVGGVRAHEDNPRSIYEGASGVFQKYQKYKMTLEENVRISRADKGEDAGPVMAKTGVDANDGETFPQGRETVLSREFDGVDLSGGQWQRVALARGFYRGGSFIVLDEPTAAIDPIEETKIYRRFAEIADDTTAIIVTHRMGSAAIADRIVVLQSGEVDDIGTHGELMARGGLYAGMFDAQAEWYKTPAGA